MICNPIIRVGGENACFLQRGHDGEHDPVSRIRTASSQNSTTVRIPDRKPVDSPKGTS